MLVLAAAAWLPARHGPVIGSTRRTLVFPSAFAAIAVGVLVYGQSVRLNPVAVALAVLALLTVMVRMALLLRETATLAVSRKLSLTDDLTGLANRRAFTAEVERAVADRRLCALLMIDLDEFKELNDTLGHHVGDELLRSVGPRLARRVRPGDVVARLGGDEFARADQGRRRRERHGGGHPAASRARAPLRARRDLAARRREHRHRRVPRARRGREHAPAPRRRRHVRGQARAHGSRRLRLRAATITAAIASSWPARCATPWRNDELTLHYQPIADLATGRLEGVEALVRWRHPERGLLAPGAFLPAIERTELMRPLSRRVLAMAICRPAPGSGSSARGAVAVNLSATDLLDRHCPTTSPDAAPHGTPARRLTLEVTESVLMADPAGAMPVLAELRGLGVQLALDGFGTGWSSLTHLQRMPVHEIKIDRSFVAAMATETTGRDRASTVDLAHALGLRVVAEGIEDEATSRRLRDVGCDAAQGYHLSRRCRRPSSRPRRPRSPSARAWRPTLRRPPPNHFWGPFAVLLAPSISYGRPFGVREAVPWSSDRVRTGKLAARRGRKARGLS